MNDMSVVISSFYCRIPARKLANILFKTSFRGTLMISALTPTDIGSSGEGQIIGSNRSHSRCE